MKFILNRNRKDGLEEKVITLYAAMNKIPFEYFNKPIDLVEGEIPVGTVDWVLNCSKYKIIPDYYPIFLSEWEGRMIWQTNEWPLDLRVFIKPADMHKRFNGRITNGGYRGKKKGPYWCSEVVHFINEWRYYVSNGEILYAGWYSGIHEEEPAPSLKSIVWPPDFCGAVDFGKTSDGRFLLVESHDPFACGWYGTLTNYEIYGKWIVEGWKYIERKYGK